jgi:hypothetical protein
MLNITLLNRPSICLYRLENFDHCHSALGKGTGRREDGSRDLSQNPKFEWLSRCCFREMTLLKTLLVKWVLETLNGIVGSKG